ncbi:dynein regulatory complex subunit 4-like [Genypterus blacodes]|uniref:dynein regulatory complex subunit 4-like n=1 Tax=Genypterus blacodes TaxID=154954 RepID=UPI003F776F52
MPPKLKGTKRSARAKTPTLIDGVSTEELSKERLEEHMVHLREELTRVREERNYFQLERDKILSFRQITERELEEEQAGLKNIEKETEEAEERHQAEIKVYKQKMKHLLCEEQNTISELRAQRADAMKQIHTEQAELEQQLCEEMSALQLQLLQDETLDRLKMKHQKEVSESRDLCEKQLRETEAENEKKFEVLQEELENMRKSEICEFEDHMNEHVNTLLKDHEEALSDLRRTWDGVLRTDAAEMEALKKESEDKKAKLAADKKRLAEALLSNKHLLEKVEEVEKEVVKHQKKLQWQETDRKLLVKTQALLKVKLKTVEERKRERDVLQQKLREIQQERDELLRCFPQKCQILEQQAEMKNSLLEAKVEALTDVLTRQRAQLQAAVSASNMDPETLSEVTKNAEDMMVSRNITIKDLRVKVAQVKQANNALLLYMEEKLRPFGIPVEELGFGSPRPTAAGLILGPGPAVSLQGHTET